MTFAMNIAIITCILKIQIRCELPSFQMISTTLYNFSSSIDHNLNSDINFGKTKKSQHK